MALVHSEQLVDGGHISRFLFATDGSEACRKTDTFLPDVLKATRQKHFLVWFDLDWVQCSSWCWLVITSQNVEWSCWNTRIRRRIQRIEQCQTLPINHQSRSIERENAGFLWRHSDNLISSCHRWERERRRAGGGVAIMSRQLLPFILPTAASYVCLAHNTQPLSYATVA